MAENEKLINVLIQFHSEIFPRRSVAALENVLHQTSAEFDDETE